MALENVNLSSDKIGRPSLWSNETDLDFCHQSATQAVNSANFSHTLILYVHGLAFYLVLCTEFSMCQSTNLKRRWLDLFCNYYHIQCVCNHSTALVVIFSCNLSFCHIFGTSKTLPLT